jgi:Zn-dependent metalloprotease
MNLPEITHQNIAQLLNKEDIINETIAQIQKDFGMYNINILFDGNTETAYEQLMDGLTVEVKELLANDKSKLQSILYRIDLSERNIKKALQHTLANNNQTLISNSNTNNFKNQQQIIAHEIIVRELKKVLTRNYFKNLG